MNTTYIKLYRDAEAQETPTSPTDIQEQIKNLIDDAYDRGLEDSIGIISYNRYPGLAANDLLNKIISVIQKLKSK